MKELSTAQVHQELVMYSNVLNLISMGLFQGQIAQALPATLEIVSKRYKEYLEEFKGRADAELYEPGINKGLEGIKGA